MSTTVSPGLSQTYGAQWFAEYQRLGGRKTRAQFDAVLEIFFATTMDAFVSGIGSRDTAIATFLKQSRECMPEFDRLFHAVDNITCYT